MLGFLSAMNVLNDTTAVASQTSTSAGGNVFTVMVIILIVWVGIFFYLFYLDRQLKKIKEKISFKENLTD